MVFPLLVMTFSVQMGCLALPLRFLRLSRSVRIHTLLSWGQSVLLNLFPEYLLSLITLICFVFLFCSFSKILSHLFKALWAILKPVANFTTLHAHKACFDMVYYQLFVELVLWYVRRTLFGMVLFYVDIIVVFSFVFSVLIVPCFNTVAFSLNLLVVAASFSFIHSGTWFRSLSLQDMFLDFPPGLMC